MADPMIQLHRLEGFYWVARCEGYARAARAFPYPITQPAVHQQVKKLEGELQLELFERVSKDRVQLTAAGKRLFDFVSPFFEGLPNVLRSLQGGEFGGVLQIRAAGMFLRELLPAWIKRLRVEFPKVRVELRELLDPDLSILRQGHADLFVDYLHEIPDDIAVMHVATMRGFLVYPSECELATDAGKEPLGIESFSEETFIGYTPGSLAHDLQTQGLAAHGVHPESTIHAASADTILGFVESGLGYSLLPSIDPAGPRGRGLVAQPITSPKVEFPVYAAWRKNTPESPLLDAVLETAPKPG